MDVILIVIFAVVVLLLVENNRLRNSKQARAPYHYVRKDYFMTKAEHDFFKKITSLLDSRYYVFAQVHLPTILDHKASKQNRKAAFWHISSKSVDFVICDRESLRPLLAIELDDYTHSRSNRIARDIEVERMLAESDLPLLRFSNVNSLTQEDLRIQLQTILNK